jgi:hypothetical protein
MSLNRWLVPGLVVVLTVALLAGILALGRGATALAPVAGPSAFLPVVLSGGPPPAVRTLANDFLFADRAGNLRVLGEVQNDLGVPITKVTVPVDLLDSGGGLLATGAGATPLSAALPGSLACFQATIADPPPGWASYTLEPPTYDQRPGPIPGLRVISDTGTLDPGYATYRLDGYVRSDDPSRVAKIRVVGTLYNGAGDVVGCAATTPVSDTLDIGQESAFSIMFGERAYFDVETYRLQAEGQAP